MKRYAILFPDGEAYLLAPDATLPEARALLARYRETGPCDLAEVDCVTLRMIADEEA